MKKFLIILPLLFAVHAFAATVDKEGTGDIGTGDVHQEEEKDLRASKSFVESCPLDYLTYFDKHEGGPGAYCQCPDENVSYIDKAEGGPGWYCAK
jgi:hypothetical protein